MACTAVSSLTLSGVQVVPAVQRQALPHSDRVSLQSRLPLLGPNKNCKGVASNGGSRVVMSATSHKEHDLPNLAALALMAAMVVPDMAEAVAPGVSPSLKNLLLSVVAGGVVLAVIGVAVAGVSTFDPVKRS